MTTTTAALPCSSHLITLRVDATDGPVRIVETILYDPTCPPLPLHSAAENAQEIAYSLISDMEVHGMHRTVRHFTNRLDLWKQTLQDKVARQIQSQLEEARDRPPPRKKRRIEHTTETKEEEEEDKPEAEKQDTTEKEPETQNSDSEDEIPDPSPDSVIHIKIRLMINGVIIKDDFDLDPTVPACPIALAEQLASDLNLPSDAAPAIATSIVEQLHGKVVVSDEKGMTHAAPAKCKQAKTAAWEIEPRDQVANIASIVAQHRPEGR